MPSCRITVLCSSMAMGRDLTQSTFVYSNYLYDQYHVKYRENKDCFQKKQHEKTSLNSGDHLW